MIYKKKGRQSVIFEEKPLIRGRGTVVGEKKVKDRWLKILT